MYSHCGSFSIEYVIDYLLMFLPLFLGCDAAADIHVHLVLLDQNVTTRQTPAK
jgi:hypothetical protein